MSSGSVPYPRTDSAPLDLLDLVRFRTAWRHHLDACALGFPDQRASERRGDRNLPFLGVCLRFSNELPNLLLLGVFVYEGYRRPELYRVARKFGHVDDFRTSELVFELHDAPLVYGLGFFGRVIF